MKYHVTFLVDATTTVEVEASSAEEAEEKAWGIIGHPRADALDPGDALRVLGVYDDEGNCVGGEDHKS